MSLKTSAARHAVALALSLCVAGPLQVPSSAAAQQEFSIKLIAETKLQELPAGPLYWRIESFPSLEQAKAAADPASLAAEADGKAWLVTLAARGGATPGGSLAAEIGPLPLPTASEYLLRLNLAGGPPGAKTKVHSHPGSEAFYVLTGQMSQRTPHGTTSLDAGQSIAGYGADTPMEVSSTGTADLQQLVMFVLDATRPSSSPAHLD